VGWSGVVWGVGLGGFGCVWDSVVRTKQVQHSGLGCGMVWGGVLCVWCGAVWYSMTCCSTVRFYVFTSLYYSGDLLFLFFIFIFIFMLILILILFLYDVFRNYFFSTLSHPALVSGCHTARGTYSRMYGCTQGCSINSSFVLN
jgi:hypothetical protein